MMDYKELSIQFYHDNQFITLKGDRDFCLQPASMYQLYRLYVAKTIANYH